MFRTYHYTCDFKTKLAICDMSGIKMFVGCSVTGDGTWYIWYIWYNERRTITEILQSET